MVKTLHFHCKGHRFHPWSGDLRSHPLKKQNNTKPKDSVVRGSGKALEGNGELSLKQSADLSRVAGKQNKADLLERKGGLLQGSDSVPLGSFP